MKRPCILFVEQLLAPASQVPIAVTTDFTAPRDMEVEALWMGATGPLGIAAAELDVDVAFKVKTRMDVVQAALYNMRLFDSGVPDRVSSIAQFGWQWMLRYAYRLKKDSGMAVDIINLCPAIGGVVQDRIGFAAHAVEAGESGRGQRELPLFGFIQRAAAAAQRMPDPTRSAQPDGKMDLDVTGIEFLRGDFALPPAGVTSVPRPSRVYAKIMPTGREAWSETYIPLPAYGLCAHPFESAGVFWRPSGSLELPSGFSFNFQARNNNAGLARLFQCAVLGYVEEE